MPFSLPDPFAKAQEFAQGLQVAVGGMGPGLQASANRVSANRQAGMMADVANRRTDVDYKLGQGKLANQRAAMMGSGWAQDPYLDSLGDKLIELSKWDMADAKSAAEANRRRAIIEKQMADYRASKGGGGGTQSSIAAVLQKLTGGSPEAA